MKFRWSIIFRQLSFRSKITKEKIWTKGKYDSSHCIRNVCHCTGIEVAEWFLYRTVSTQYYLAKKNERLRIENPFNSLYQLVPKSLCTFYRVVTLQSGCKYANDWYYAKYRKNRDCRSQNYWRMMMNKNNLSMQIVKQPCAILKLKSKSFI